MSRPNSKLEAIVLAAIIFTAAFYIAVPALSYAQIVPDTSELITYGSNPSGTITTAATGEYIFACIETGGGSTVSSVTDNSVPMTFIASEGPAPGTGTAYLYYIVDSATVNLVQVVSTAAEGGLVAYSGVDSLGVESATGNSSAETFTQTSIVPDNANGWMIWCTGNGYGNPSAGTGSNLLQSSGSSAFGLFDSGGVVGSTAYTMSASVEGAAGWNGIMQEIDPAGASSSATSTSTVLPINEDELLFILAIFMFFIAIPFWERTFSVTRNSYDV